MRREVDFVSFFPVAQVLITLELFSQHFLCVVGDSRVSFGAAFSPRPSTYLGSFCLPATFVRWCRVFGASGIRLRCTLRIGTPIISTTVHDSILLWIDFGRFYSLKILRPQGAACLLFLKRICILQISGPSSWVPERKKELLRASLRLFSNIICAAGCCEWAFSNHIFTFARRSVLCRNRCVQTRVGRIHCRGEVFTFARTGLLGAGKLVITVFLKISPGFFWDGRRGLLFF